MCLLLDFATAFDHLSWMFMFKKFSTLQTQYPKKAFSTNIMSYVTENGHMLHVHAMFCQGVMTRLTCYYLIVQKILKYEPVKFRMDH